MKDETREMAVGGFFYPKEKYELFMMIEEFLDKEKDNIKSLKNKIDDLNGVIVPHAGWIFSGQNAINPISLISKFRPGKIAIIGPSHRYPLKKIVTDSNKYWKTPIKINEIIKDNNFEELSLAHHQEHSIEVIVPMINYFSPESSILPLVTGEIDNSQAHETAKYLYENNYFIIISTDMSHFYPLEKCEKIDKKSIENIEKMNESKIEACGINALKIGFEFCKLKSTKPKLIKHTNSSHITKNESSVVGYASFYF